MIFEKLHRQATFDKALGQVYSRVLDIYDDEKSRGKTFEYSTLDFMFDDDKYQIIDTPGHKSFIREMINGLCHFEASHVIGCLLLSAREGEFESGWIRGQTKEAIIIARSLGITDLVIIINKMDTAGWDKSIYEEIVKTSESYISNVCGFKNYKYVPVSAYDGIGLVDSIGYPSWYNGDCFLKTLKSVKEASDDRAKNRELKQAVVMSNKFKAKLKIFNCENIITAGYECVIHYCGNEYDCSIVKVKNNKILRTGDCELCILSTTPQLDQVYDSNRFLIRKNQLTIGFGILID